MFEIAEKEEETFFKFLQGLEQGILPSTLQTLGNTKNEESLEKT